MKRSRLAPLFAALICGSAAPARAETFAPGDKVVAVWSGGSYYSGTVKSVDGDQAIVAWDDGSAPSASPIATMLHKPAADAKPALNAGDAGYCCYSGTAWSPCLVTELKSGQVVVLNPSNDQSATLGLASVLIPTGEVAQKLNASVEQAKAALALRKSIQAQKPPAGDGSGVQKGDWVLALWNDGKYWEARVLERQGAAVRLLWTDGQISDGYDLKNLVPYPSVDQAYEIKNGDVLYVKWSASPTWYVARVESALGADVIEVLYQDGSRGKTRRGRYLPQQGAATK